MVIVIYLVLVGLVVINLIVINLAANLVVDPGVFDQVVDSVIVIDNPCH